MQIYSRTDVGLVREINQDACRYGMLSDTCAWAVVCDGMGGENGGNVASKIAVETISDIIQSEYLDELSDETLSDLIIKAVQTANNNIYQTAINDISLSGMGTTAELAFLRNNLLYIAHVGDSRAYIMRGNKIKQITKDHSLVQEMIESGELTPEEAKVHPNKNLITRALGISEDIKLDFIEAPAQSGDILILTTDGLTNYVYEDEMVSVISNGDVSSACEHLVDMAKSAGGSDNITVTLIIV